MKRLVLAFFVAMGLGTALAEEIHGKTDVFSSPQVKLAWAILRGSDEARTFVVVRMLVKPEVKKVVITGRDPFSGQSKELQRMAVAGRAEVRISRDSFVHFPRTEWQLTGADLTVFYLGIPDTTPEFADATKLDAYMEARLAALSLGER